MRLGTFLTYSIIRNIKSGTFLQPAEPGLKQRFAPYPYSGTQKYLMPDLILERFSDQENEKETIIFDAKYKGHWEDFNFEQWGRLDEDLRERHRADLLQVLAYSTISEAKKIVSCLVYPCKKQNWERMKARSEVYHRASLNAGRRNVSLVLTAVPMEADIEEIVQTLAMAVV